ncbi:hypothetical protein [Rhodococcus sp. NPDC059234]|uniref:hypothetical protein n=1 Tax=Rhodococcus sp. NPDC059234 TaxID=3346781 RepID=UPI0036723188
MRWILAQREPALELEAGASGLDREATRPLTRNSPNRSSGSPSANSPLTTGRRLPLTRSGRTRHLVRHYESGVAAIGFGTGLTQPAAPDDLVSAAEYPGLPRPRFARGVAHRPKLAAALERAMRQAGRPLSLVSREGDVAMLLQRSATPDSARKLLRGLPAPVLRSPRVGVSAAPLLAAVAWRSR